MRLVSTAGCCAASVIADLGAAHDHPRWTSLDRFVVEVKRVVNGANQQAYYAFTNAFQTTERGYLTAMGFAETRIGSLKLHSISGTELRKFFAESPIFEEERKRLAEEAKKREEARQKALKEAHELRERRKKEREEARAARIAAGLPATRKRGELRVGDDVYRYRARATSFWQNSGIVQEVGPNQSYVIISGIRIENPTYNTGNGFHTVERVRPSNGHRWW
ncbi:MAG: hypothetical protein EKK63_10185 [Acinetobacter sp.]|uniref:hypothetical protein n=1 Tax=Acinetobacter sp. TaxID=472 RepID=UPI000FA7F079|nr:hypothetical protein [Acinetobacter sp.]RUP39357.1 MAG: hypothetical protein EKK63_10185 [Acinetobacter sp.]